MKSIFATLLNSSDVIYRYNVYREKKWYTKELTTMFPVAILLGSWMKDNLMMILWVTRMENEQVEDLRRASINAILSRSVHISKAEYYTQASMEKWQPH